MTNALGLTHRGYPHTKPPSLRVCPDAPRNGRCPHGYARLYTKDGDDLGVREFSEPNWTVGDTVALRDRVYRVVYLGDDGEVRGMLEEPPST